MPFRAGPIPSRIRWLMRMRSPLWVAGIPTLRFTRPASLTPSRLSRPAEVRPSSFWKGKSYPALRRSLTEKKSSERSLHCLEFLRGELVWELNVLVRKDSPFHLHHRRIPALKAFDKGCSSHFRLDHISAREDINGSVRVLRPGVNGQMRLRDYNHAADAKGIKFMEGNIYDGGFCFLCCGNQSVSYFIEALQDCWVTIPQFH